MQVVRKVTIEGRHPDRPTSGNGNGKAQEMFDALWDLVQQCSATDPKARPNMKFVAQALCATSSLGAGAGGQTAALGPTSAEVEEDIVIGRRFSVLQLCLCFRN